MKYLIILKLDLNTAETVEHVIEADSFDRTDFDVVFWRKDFFGKKESIAFYQMSHVVCAVTIQEDELKVRKLGERANL